MRLADFIVRNMEPILERWDAFASTLLPAAADMKPRALRDHAQGILEAVAKDLTTPQTREAQLEKSWGHAPKPAKATETAAQAHAILRARGGFNINQLAAEYRALRASVLRLWTDDCQSASEPPDLDDIVRFNEAIDQALAESVQFFSVQVDQSRNLLLGMLGHDMRSPLQTIQTTASYLAALNAGEKVSEAAGRLIRSGTRMQGLLDDLCDFNRTKLGLGINVHPAEIDLADVLTDEVDQLRAVYPDRRIELEMQGNMRGVWDGKRLQQMVDNLVTNALKYGTPDAAVHVAVTGDDKQVNLTVKNNGASIDSAVLKEIFEPLQRGAARDHYEGETSLGLGLGLYIVSEIAKAHHGTVVAHSGDKETSFEVSLPRQK